MLDDQDASQVPDRDVDSRDGRCVASYLPACSARWGFIFLPPGFSCRYLSPAVSLQGVDLRELFSFDKLSASGRVSVITTAEFLEREAVTGNLGVQPDERVTLLDMKVCWLVLFLVGEGLPWWITKSPHFSGNWSPVSFLLDASGTFVHMSPKERCPFTALFDVREVRRSFPA